MSHVLCRGGLPWGLGSEKHTKEGHCVTHNEGLWKLWRRRGCVRTSHQHFAGETQTKMLWNTHWFWHVGMMKMTGSLAHAEINKRNKQSPNLIKHLWQGKKPNLLVVWVCICQWSGTTELCSIRTLINHWSNITFSNALLHICYCALKQAAQSACCQSLLEIRACVCQIFLVRLLTFTVFFVSVQWAQARG